MKLRNGIEIPDIGFGTWKTPNDEICLQAIQTAVDCGYRHIDGAYIYKNEESVGQAIHNCGIPRHELFITNKVWNTQRGYQSTLDALDQSLQTMGLDYFDLYLIHWPANALNYQDPVQVNKETWQAMIDAYKQGKVKAIGVSNFMERHLEPLMDMEIIPMVNQIEYHVGLTRPGLVSYCQGKGMIVEAYSPLGRANLLDKEELIEIAKKYNRTVSQICLRFILQNNVLPLPKSVTPSRIQENIDVFDFELSKEDMDYLNALDLGCITKNPDEMRP
ncbi:aldo/keto reductase [Floccifex sp.]|uniref:aldo/keto reductase n=1 Tax=Floccifex sp. TaxID=2815810 RepID=UPI003F02AF87